MEIILKGVVVVNRPFSVAATQYALSLCVVSLLQ